MTQRGLSKYTKTFPGHDVDAFTYELDTRMLASGLPKIIHNTYVRD